MFDVKILQKSIKKTAENQLKIALMGVLGAPGSLLGASWWRLGASWCMLGRLGPSRGRLGVSWVRLGALLARSWALVFSKPPPGNILPGPKSVPTPS